MNPSILELVRMFAVRQYRRDWGYLEFTHPEAYLLGLVRAVREAHQ